MSREEGNAARVQLLQCVRVYNQSPLISGKCRTDQAQLRIQSRWSISMQRDDSSPLQLSLSLSRSLLSGNGASESTGDSPSFNVGILMYIATINQGH